MKQIKEYILSQYFKGTLNGSNTVIRSFENVLNQSWNMYVQKIVVPVDNLWIEIEHLGLGSRLRQHSLQFLRVCIIESARMYTRSG